MLHLYRRHRLSCAHRSQNYRRCQCPIYVKGTLGNSSVRMGLDQTNWDAATRIVAGWTAAGKIGQIIDTSTTTVDAVDKYLADAIDRGLSHGTMKKLRRLLTGQLVPWCQREGLILVDSLTLDALTRFRGTWSDGPLARSKKQERLRSFFRWCAARKWVTDNPAAELSTIRLTEPPTLPFTSTECTQILAAIDTYPARNSSTLHIRLRAFILLLRWTGLRIGDVVSMEWTRVQDGKVFLYTQKTGTPVSVPVPQLVIDALGKLEKRGKYLFWTGNGKLESGTTGWQRSLRKLFIHAKLPDAHAHRFRDTFAVELLLKGVDIADVSILLGHRSIKVTEKHYSPWITARQARLESAVQKTWYVPTSSGESVPDDSSHTPHHTSQSPQSVH